jgi:thiol-disulfide isomerase/thioredoxin
MLFFALLIFISKHTMAQCNISQSQVKIVLRTDNYGHETFWQIKNAQTNAVIKSGGNPKAYPGGLRGTAATDPGAYPASTIVKDSVCINHGSIIKFVIYDAYGDGICCNYGNGYYYVFVDNDTIISNPHFTVNDSTIFSVPLPVLDLTVSNVVLGDKITLGNHFIDGEVKNKGKETITSFTLNWTINDGAIRKETYENLNITTSKSFKFKHKYGWSANTIGTHELKMWVSDVNNMAADDFTTNDTLKKTLTVFQNNRVVLVEVWTNASCAPCARYVPPLEYLLDHTNNHAVSIMYHSDFPGFDIMNTHNPQQSAARGNYYGVNSYPTWFIDGADQGNGFVTEEKLYDRSLIPADFDFIDPQVWIENDTLYAKTTFQARSNFTGNFRAHAVVIERDMDFTNGPNPGSNGEKIFDWVMKYMLTGPGGKNIGTAFVAGKTDSISGKWAIANVMDTTQLAVIFFIQNNAGKEVRATQMVALRELPDFSEPPANTGIQTAEHSAFIRTYPNPAKNILTIELNSNTKGTLNIHLVNMLGQQLYNLQLSEAAQSEIIHVDVSPLKQGIYNLIITGKDFKSVSKVAIGW